MPKSKKGIRLSENMPRISIESVVRCKPVGSTKGKATNKKIGPETTDCREETIWNVREEMQYMATKKASRDCDAAYWDVELLTTHDIDLEDSSLKQYGQTKLILDSLNEYGEASFHSCCLQNMIQIMDTLVGNLNLVLDPDPYYGDWWRSPARENNYGQFVYHGVNNSCLQHPAILHITLGMFRQAMTLFTDGKYEGLLKAVPYKDTEKALTDANWKQAWKNLEAARPWIEVISSYYTHWPFPNGYWPRLQALHRALYQKGPTKLFGQSSIAERWDLTGKLRGDSIICDGAWSYFGYGKAGNRLTDAGKRLFKLGK